MVFRHQYVLKFKKVCVITIIIALTPLKFDVDNATKNYEKIIDWGPFKGSGVGYDLEVAYIKQFLSIMCHMQLIQWEFLTENFEN